MKPHIGSIFMTAVALISTFSIFNLVSGQTTGEDKTRIGGETIDRMVQLRTHSLYAPYIDQDLQSRWWDFGADAYVNTNKHVRLTQNKPSQMGWLWSRLSISAINYVIEVEFKISGDSSHLYGDGLALWLTKERAHEGPIFGSKDKFSGIGVFLDTYSNGHHEYDFPRISAMLGDGQTSFDFRNDGHDQSIGGCSANFRRTSVATKLRVTYFRDKLLDVKIQHKAWDDWTDCFQVKNISLPSLPYLGLTAMTGDVSDFHDIIAVTTYSATLAKETFPNKDQGKMGYLGGKQKTSQGSGLSLLWKLLILIGLCAGGYFGYQEYQRRQSYGGSGSSGMGYGSGNADFRGGMYSGNKRLY